jgi:sec-independent protein translocase protein TatB
MGTLPTIEVANLGMADSLILMVLALVVFGPRRLPQIGRQIGKLMYEFRKASNDFKFQMEEELRNAEEADRKKKEEAERQQALALAPPAEPGAPTVEETAPNQSPYPYETEYPALDTPENEAGPLYADIQTPAAGEPVPAETSADAASAAETASETGSAPSPEAGSEPDSETGLTPAAEPAAVAEEVPQEKEAPVSETSKVTEPANQNG